MMSGPEVKFALTTTQCLGTMRNARGRSEK
jgi:hypothetical protein